MKSNGIKLSRQEFEALGASFSCPHNWHIAPGEKLATCSGCGEKREPRLTNLTRYAAHAEKCTDVYWPATLCTCGGYRADGKALQ